MIDKSRITSTLFKSLLAASLVLPVFPFASPAAAAQGLSVWLDGKALTYQQPLTVQNGTTYVPLRETLEALGAKVEWNAETGTIQISKGALNFSYDPQTDEFEGVQKPISQNGRFMIHIRALPYLLGTDLKWNAEKQKIELDTHKTDLIEAIKSKNVESVKAALKNGANPNAQMFDMEYKMESTLLHYAMDSYDLSILKAMLEAGADPNLAGGEHVPMDGAMLIGRNNVVKLLLEYGANPATHFGGSVETVKTFLNAKSKDQIPASALNKALFEAIQSQNVELIKVLLEAGADPTVSREIEESTTTASLLFDAVKLNNKAIVSLLLEHGVDPNKQNEEGWSALMMAAYFGHAQVAKTLLAADADSELKMKQGATAWMIAQAQGNSNTAQVLLDGGAKTGDVPSDLRLFDPADEFYEMFLQDMDAMSPLFQAALYGKTEEVKRLLQEGHTTMNEVERQVLDWMLYLGHSETLTALLSDATLIDQPTKDRLLQHAVDYANPDIIHALLESGADPTSSHSILEEAVKNNNVPIIEDLLKHGAKQIHAEEEYIASPLSVAANVGNPDAIRTLLANMGILPPAQRSQLISEALRDAVTLGNRECFELLLATDLDPKDLGLALYSAVSAGDVEAVTNLLQKGADPNFTAWNGSTPLQLAKKRGNTEIITLLQSANS